MQAIETRFLGPTDYRGSRAKATCEAGTVTLSWDHALNPEQNHDAAARALIVERGWTDRAWVRGAVAGRKGYVYCQDLEWTRLDLEAGVSS